MRKDEFIKKARDLGLQVEVTHLGNYAISTESKGDSQWGTEIARVSGTEVASLDTYTDEFAKLTDYHRVSIIRLLSEFASTPVGERNDELSYYLRPIPMEIVQEKDVLNYNVDRDEWMLASKKGFSEYKTTFTEKELKKLGYKLADFAYCEVNSLEWLNKRGEQK